jgi:hypothetical protein
MAREIEIIQNEMIAQLASNGITVSGSRTSIRRKWTYAWAYCANVIEKLFDAHRDETLAIIDTLMPHTLKWYAQLALNFQYGQNINTETGIYDNTGLSDEQITDQKIIARSAVTEIDGALRIKVARLVAGDLSPLDAAQKVSFIDYVQKLKDAGVRIKIDSLPADQLKLSIDIFYNPLVLTAAGGRIDGISITPVPDAVNTYLGNLPFNGEYANTRLTDALQRVDGVELVVINNAMTKFGLFPFTAIDERYIPDAGYLRVAAGDLTINYRAYVQY